MLRMTMLPVPAGEGPCRKEMVTSRGSAEYAGRRSCGGSSPEKRELHWRQNDQRQPCRAAPKGRHWAADRCVARSDQCQPWSPRFPWAKESGSAARRRSSASLNEAA